MLDSTGLELFGQGEWDAEKHGRARRQWRKLHLAVDADTGEIAAYVPVHGLSDLCSGHAAFLRGMLGRERLFHTERFHHRLDMTARANLRRGLHGLAT